MPATERRSVVVIGAGPAGLTAAYRLSQQGIPVTVLEASPDSVGGISRTVECDGYRFDIGGHRFFSKSPVIEALWSEMLSEPLLERPRLSRIYYRNRFFSYPLRPVEALRKLGPIEAGRCVVSYLQARRRPHARALSFEDWVVNRFGRRLFEIFFKTYTEKVWGMACRDISADWAAQRIGTLSLGSALLPDWAVRAVRPGRARAKTLTQTFRYPRLGPGMLWESCAATVRERGGVVRLGREVTRCTWDAGTGSWTVEHRGADGQVETTTATDVVSSAALSDLAARLLSGASAEVRGLGAALRYRDFITVGLIVAEAQPFPDQWIYVHDPSVRVGRVQNYAAWSPAMVPEPGTSSLGLEYFCGEHDDLWALDDTRLVALAWDELQRIGLAHGGRLLRGHVIRQPRAYPVYDAGYDTRVARIREELEQRYPTLHVVGRNGMHKYNNQDHAMMTALLTVDNIIAGRRVADVWRVNADAEYLEEDDDAGSGQALRYVPQAVEKGGEAPGEA